MRRVVVSCRSRRLARPVVGRILDRYFWREDARRWSGRASNACLDRVAHELHAAAGRAMAVGVYDSDAQDAPLFSVGNAAAFKARAAPEGPDVPPAARALREIVVLAALFHDLGKALLVFTGKIDRVLDGAEGAIADVVRHEVHSYYAWLYLTRGLDDAGALRRLETLDAETVEAAMRAAADDGVAFARRVAEAGVDDARLVEAEMWPARTSGVRETVGRLILSHHRLAMADDGLADLVGRDMARAVERVDPAAFAIDGEALPWRDPAWLTRVARTAGRLSRLGAAEMTFPVADLHARTALMIADHLGSARKVARDSQSRPIANTVRTQDARGKTIVWPGDDVTTHTMRVAAAIRVATRGLIVDRGEFPALRPAEVPDGVRRPCGDGPARFAWQAAAAEAAARAGARGGGFFAAIAAGTGIGKTRAAPTILAAATFADPDPDRRGLRYNLALGLRALARQSAAEYTHDLGFAARDVRAMMGGGSPEGTDEASGSEDRLSGVDVAALAPGGAGIPPADADDTDWLRGLSYDVDRKAPRVVDEICAVEAGKRDGTRFRDLADAPILVATIDQLMGVTAPVRSWHLPAAMRVISSDLVIDEVDLFSEEDVCAVARLIFYAGLAGRRVIVMSATLTADLAGRLYDAYRQGYGKYAEVFGGPDRVGHLVCGDTPESVREDGVSGDGAAGFRAAFRESASATVAEIAARPVYRPGEILPIAPEWWEAVAAIDGACRTLHDRHACSVDDLRVSVGLVRVARTRHAMAIARALGDAPPRPGVLRVVACLHARFPARQRGAMEAELKRMLTRKGARPNAGLARVLAEQGVLAQAREQGCTEIEIVVVATPVIETGNDLDFDWAVVDPTGLRAIVQVAGRVNRHRLMSVRAANVAILERGLVAIETGRLEKPGVETRPARATGVARLYLARFVPHADPRRTSRLLGEENAARIDASLYLDPARESVLRAAEIHLRDAYFDGRPDLARFTSADGLRFLGNHAAARQFRRKEGDGMVIFPIVSGDGDLSGWAVVDRASPAGHVALPAGRGRPERVGAEMAHARALFRGGLSWALQADELTPRGSPTDVARRSFFVEVSWDAARAFGYDPILGLISDREDPRAAFGRRQEEART